MKRLVAPVVLLAAFATFSMGQVPKKPPAKKVELKDKLPGKGKIEWQFDGVETGWKVTDVTEQKGTLALELQLQSCKISDISKVMRRESMVDCAYTKPNSTFVLLAPFLVAKGEVGTEAVVGLQTSISNARALTYSFQGKNGKELAKGTLKMEVPGDSSKNAKIKSGERAKSTITLPKAADLAATEKVVFAIE